MRFIVTTLAVAIVAALTGFIASRVFSLTPIQTAIVVGATAGSLVVAGLGIRTKANLDNDTYGPSQGGA